ncbi:MAG: ShlB/FhaC/HecB family hemolysin secretion/activation protein, partial [Candidatus Xenobia bacterium]
GGFLGGTPNGSTLASRAGAGDSFTKFNVDGVDIIKAGNTHFWALRFSGQVTGNSLLIGEQFSLGGPDSVRGFQQSQVLTDSGFSASAEYHISTNKKHTAEIVLFYDTGTGWLQLPLAGQQASASLTGTGFGYRTQLGPDAAFRFDLGFPVSQTAGINQSNPVPYISLNSRF